jgi:hypothetical protein
MRASVTLGPDAAPVSRRWRILVGFAGMEKTLASIKAAAEAVIQAG